MSKSFIFSNTISGHCGGRMKDCKYLETNSGCNSFTEMGLVSIESFNKKLSNCLSTYSAIFILIK